MIATYIHTVAEGRDATYTYIHTVAEGKDATYIRSLNNRCLRNVHHSTGRDATSTYKRSLKEGSNRSQHDLGQVLAAGIGSI